MKHVLCLMTGFAVVLISSRLVFAQAKTPTEDDYYKLHRYILPEGEVLEAGALEMLPDGKIALGTRRGEVWIIERGLTDSPKDAVFTRFAHGLHEILGLAYKDGWLYVTHRPDVTRIKYADKEKADVFEVVADGWEVNGDY